MNVKQGPGVVFTFGRMQPCTIGHKHLIDQVVKVARDHGYESIIFLSQSQKPSTDPLPWHTKVDIVRQYCPYAVVSDDPAIKTPFQALESLCATHQNIIFVAGADRIDFADSMHRYALQWGAKSFTLVCAGSRNDATLLGRTSGSTVRQCALRGDFDEFRRMMPPNDIVTEKVFEILRHELTKGQPEQSI